VNPSDADSDPALPAHAATPSASGPGLSSGSGSGSSPAPRAAKLTAEQFARVHEIFSAAIDQPEARRSAFIAAQAPHDDQVRSAVSELLEFEYTDETRFSPEQGGLISRVIDGAKLGDEAIPAEFGQYRIERLIGKGGMGVVYLATQANPQRQVALKLLASSAPSQSLRTRFAREIDVLGRLDDPGIARIFEAGTQATPSGPVSYFAMEYVQGPRLTDFAKQQQLSIAARIELVAKVADALHHAHTKGVLHRDLKPANILVAAPAAPTTTLASQHTTAQGPQPKILDFGVARLLEGSTHHTALTEAGLLIGTVAYMSPEQLSGDQTAVDTRSDIYALGVVLYELLADRLPFDVLTKPIAEAARIIRDDPPAPLSTIHDAPRIDQDVATIIAKAMHKDRDRRYSSAAAFADDLRRYLRSEPITARPPTVVYQLSKFAQRNRTLVAITAAASLAVIAGLVVSATLYFREQQARQRADREARLSAAIRDYMLEGLLLAASPARMGYDVKMLDVLAHATDGLHDRFAQDPEIEGEVRWLLANVLGQLGREKESLAELEHTLPLVEKTIGPDTPRAVAILTQMAQSYRNLDQPQRSLELATMAIDRSQRGRLIPSSQAASAYGQAGIALAKLGRHDESIAMLNEALSVVRRCDKPDEQLGLTLLSWLQASHKAKGNTSGALETARQISAGLQQYRGRDNELTIAARNNLINELVTAKLLDEASRLATDLPESAQRTFPPGHPTRGYTALTAASVMVATNQFAQAEQYSAMAYDAFLVSFDDVHWTTERALAVSRINYAKWGGHAEQLTNAGLQAARIRLMVANADERATTLKAIQDIAGEWRTGGHAATPQSVVQAIWDQRDTLAPTGHNRRAVFMANLACVMAAIDHREHFQDALAAARESLAAAKHPDVAQALLTAAETLSIR